jgi:hypothetical protein
LSRDRPWGSEQAEHERENRGKEEVLSFHVGRRG